MKYTIALICVAMLSTSLVGCAGMHLPKTMTQGDIAPKREQRNKELVDHFDQKRDFAEFEAAKSRWNEQGDAKGCREALEKLLARNPSHREARLLMAELLLSQINPQGAYQHAKAALDAYPNDAQVHFTMAMTLEAQGNMQDALGYYERAMKIEPQNEAYSAAYQSARESAGGGLQKPQAVTLQNIQPFDNAPVETVAYTAPATGSPDRANWNGNTNSIEFAGIAENDPAVEHLRNGMASLAQGSSPAALDSFRRAAATNPNNPQILLAATGAVLRANRPDLAVEILTPGTKQFPNSAAIYRMLGVSYYRMGDFKSSQVALQQALSLDKSSALSYLLMGCTLAKLGQNEAAESHFRQARALDPKYKVVR